MDPAMDMVYIIERGMQLCWDVKEEFCSDAHDSTRDRERLERRVVEYSGPVMAPDRQEKGAVPEGTDRVVKEKRSRVPSSNSPSPMPPKPLQTSPNIKRLDPLELEGFLLNSFGYGRMDTYEEGDRDRQITEDMPQAG
ncbi:hypothetical protein CLU79DRAFT_719094 [Phycomyces nitens]|nr:hypothetical protein CLU79DRAFT_719094 [Phycomyces nitens]